MYEPAFQDYRGRRRIDVFTRHPLPPLPACALIAQARNGGAWDQPGITSSAARTHASHATTLGILNGSEYTAASGKNTFNGVPFAANDTLVKYTYYGDADFSGSVDFDDYVRTDAGYNLGRTGWLNGDFNLDGLVDFDDYVLIDLGFNSQGLPR